jgi:xylulokinase
MYSLGIEFSTQSCKLVVLDVTSSHVIYTGSFDYDSTFPAYGTKGGVLLAEDSGIRHTSPFMLIEALDGGFDKLKNDGIDLSRIKAVKADGMQHCTVYTDESFGKEIRTLDPRSELIEQLHSTVTRKTSPIWEDRSPVKESVYLTEFLRDWGGIEHLTGNRAELRFPAAQILKWAKESPDEYTKTANIFLLSAFITSILAGTIAPVDTGDGWGTNLNDLSIDNPGWSKAALSAADAYLHDKGVDAPLRTKIGTMNHYDSYLGTINRYFVEKYGIDPESIVIAGTGDNPATLLGCGGQTVISLGSSYTVNGVMRDVIPSTTGEYNVFGYLPGTAMALSVITNGGKVHEHFLRQYIVSSEDKELKNEDWDDFVSAAGDSLLSEYESLMLPYLHSESVPLSGKGIVRDGIPEDDAQSNIRALFISQVLSLKLHSIHLSDVDAICIAGGGATNRFMMQLISDIFKAETYTINHADFAAPLGCAISGAKALLNISYQEAIKRFVQKETSSFLHPIKENLPKVDLLLDRYRILELEARRI